MSTFLNKEAICTEITNLIREADKELFIITPYIKLSDAIFDSLRKADENGVIINLVYRTGKLNNEERIKLKGLRNLNLFALNDIHSKCYFHESKMIIASM